MRSLNELQEIKEFIIEINSFENIAKYTGKSMDEKIEIYTEDQDLRGRLSNHFINTNLMNASIAITQDRMTNLHMEVYAYDEEDNNELKAYCKKCDYTGDYYLIEDMTELEEDLWVSNSKVNEYAIPVDDEHYHKKIKMFYANGEDEFILDEDNFNVNYKRAEDGKYYHIDNLTEVRFGSGYHYDNDYEIRYIHDEDVLDEYYRRPEDDRDNYYHIDLLQYIECEDEYVFDRDFLSDNYNWCDECEEYFPSDNGMYLELYDRWVCDDCLENYYSCTCEVCGEHIHDGDELYEEDEEGNEHVYCSSCYRRNGGATREDTDGDCLIGGYHCNHGVWKQYKLEDEENPLFYMGYELETEPKRGGRYNVSKAAHAANDNINCILSRDGSLSTNGFEIVSQPQTYNYIMAQYEKYKEAFEKIVDAGYVSHNSTHCGLHFHVTAPKENRDTIVSRLWLIIESYKEEFKALSRRKGDFSWCQFLSDRQYNQASNMKSIYKIAKVSKRAKDDTRYLVINDRNENTIEIRLFRGTLNIDTFYANVQLVKNLFEEAYNIDKPITEIRFSDLIQGEYIQKYCETNNIRNDNLIVDETDLILEKEKKLLNLAKNVLDMTWRYVEELKIEYAQLTEKKAINKTRDLIEIRDSLSDASRRVNNVSNYYISMLIEYRNRNTDGILYHINNFEDYIRYSEFSSKDAILKKINKIHAYAKEI